MGKNRSIRSPARPTHAMAPMRPGRDEPNTLQTSPFLHHLILIPTGWKASPGHWPIHPRTCEWDGGEREWARRAVKNNKTLPRWVGGQIHPHQLAPGNSNEEDGPVVGCDVGIELPVAGDPGGWPSGLMHPPYVDMAFFGQAHHGTIGVERGGGESEIGDA